MKLTDKDLLEDAVQGAINIMEANGINMISASVPLAIIKGAPTIEAIPVNWISAYMNQAYGRVRAEIIREMLDVWMGQEASE